MSLSPTIQGVVVAIALAGAAIGAAIAGYLSDRAGRRPLILGAGLLFVAGALISALAQDVAVLLIGRFLVGLAIGVASMLTPLYLAEISPARDRGAIVSLNQLCITIGILVSYLVGFALAGSSGGWRWMLASARCRASFFPLACWSCRRVRDGLQGTAEWGRRGGPAAPARRCGRLGELNTLRTDLAPRAQPTGKRLRNCFAPRLRRPSSSGSVWRCFSR